MHGAYALDGNDIILINTLVVQTLDQEELQATLDSISLAIVEHYEKLTKFFNQKNIFIFVINNAPVALLKRRILEMGILDRFKRVVRSNINDMISKAEDPEKMLNQLIMEMNEQLSESKKSVAHAIADEKKLERQLSEHKKNSDKWEQNAMLAVRSGKEDLAKKALLRKEEYDQYVTSFKDQYEQQH